MVGVDTISPVVEAALVGGEDPHNRDSVAAHHSTTITKALP